MAQSNLTHPWFYFQITLAKEIMNYKAILLWELIINIIRIQGSEENISFKQHSQSEVLGSAVNIHCKPRTNSENEVNEIQLYKNQTMIGYVQHRSSAKTRDIIYSNKTRDYKGRWRGKRPYIQGIIKDIDKAEVKIEAFKITFQISEFEKDHVATYKCKTLYRNETETENINLTIYKPATKPLLMDQDGDSIGTQTKPHKLYSNITIMCSSTGNPKPSTKWIIDNSKNPENQTIVKEGTTITIINLTRQHDNKAISCLSNNEDSSNTTTTEKETTTSINMILPPEAIKIETQETTVAGNQLLGKCTMINAKPKPIVIWSIGNTTIDNSIT